VGDLAAYRAVFRARLRSQTVYRVSFGLEVFGTAMVALTDFAEVYAIFHNVPTLGGLSVGEAYLLFGLGTLGFSLANAVFGELDKVPEFIRTGSLEVMLLRPQPLLAQVVTGDVRLKRIGGIGVGLVVLAVGLRLVEVDWTPSRVALAVLSPLSGALVFGALFIVAGAIQFWLVDAGEVTNSLTYGSAYASRYSSAALPLPIRLLFVFVLPAGFTAYLPTLALLGRPGPAWVPGWLGWGTPVAALVSMALAVALWQLGVRHYTGAGG
jgi:ABC-2 type transport system permease protein